MSRAHLNLGCMTNADCNPGEACSARNICVEPDLSSYAPLAGPNNWSFPDRWWRDGAAGSYVVFGANPSEQSTAGEAALIRTGRATENLPLGSLALPYSRFKGLRY